MKNFLKIGTLVKQTFVNGLHKYQYKTQSGATLTNLRGLAPYGFSFFAKPGAKIIQISNGKHNGVVAILVGDSRYEIELLEGEVAVHDDQGQKVHFKRDNKIVIESLGEVIIDVPTTLIKQALICEGGVTITGGLESNGIDMDNHTHPFTDTGKTPPASVTEGPQ